MTYDKEYANLMENLEKKEERETKSTFFEGLEGFTDNELYELHLRCSRETERMEVLSAEDTKRLNQMREGKVRGFKIMVWSLKGDLDNKQVLANLEAMAQRLPELRTNYIYQGVSRPVRVIYKNVGSILKFVDFRSVESDKRRALLWNVAAAQTRKMYDVQTDPAVKILGFMEEKKFMTVMLVMNSFLPLSMEPKTFMSKVFAGMQLWYGDFGIVSAKRVEKMNREMTQTCLDYWKKEITSVGEALELPGAQTKTSGQRNIDGSLYKTLDKELTEKITAYCKEQGCTQKALFLTVWGELLGRRQGVQEPVVAANGAGERMHLFPIKIRREMSVKERIADADRQLKACHQYSACTFDELGRTLAIEEGHFRVVQNYIEFEDGEEITDIADKTANINMGMEESGGVDLSVSYYLFGKETSINYLYDRSLFYDVAVERIHELFLKLLEELISVQKKEFNLREEIELTDNTVERLKMIRTAQKALYIKQSGLFDRRSAEELMDFAQKSDLRSYAMNDVVLAEGQAVCAFGFLVEGNIEESRTGADGVIRSVSVRKAGEVFAVEAVLDDNVTRFSYTASSKETKILWVERKDLLEFLNEEPENWRSLLGVVFKEAYRMKRLWTAM